MVHVEVRRRVVADEGRAPLLLRIFVIFPARARILPILTGLEFGFARFLRDDLLVLVQNCLHVLLAPCERSLHCQYPIVGVFRRLRRVVLNAALIPKFGLQVLFTDM